MARKAKRNRPPKQLRQAKKRTNALMKGALEAFNKRARRTHKDRQQARVQIQQMIEDEKEKERLWKLEQAEKAGETGILAGILMGGMTGAKLGSMTGNPWGTAIGAVGGAIGGGLYGAQEGGMADIAAVSPYAAGISNLAGQYTAAQQGKERFGKLLDLYKNRGTGEAGQLPAPASVFGAGTALGGTGTDGTWPTGAGATTGWTPPAKLPNVEGVVPGTLAANPYRYNVSKRDLAQAGLPYGGTTERFNQRAGGPRYISDDPNYLRGDRQNILDKILALSGSR